MASPIGPESVTLDEFEQQAAPTPPKLADVKFDGEEVPEEYRGKTAAELMTQAKALAESLKLSENARKQAEMNANLAIQRPQQALPEPPKEEPELTDEQLNEIHQTDPLKAIRLMNAQAIRVAEKNLEARLGPMFQGTTAAVESAARQKYATEFELFGDQITKIASELPNGRAVLSNPAAWDDLVAIVKGRSGNWERFVEREIEKRAGNGLKNAQDRAREAVPTSLAPATRAPVVGSAPQLDALQLEIAEKLGMTPADYVKWSKV